MLKNYRPILHLPKCGKIFYNLSGKGFDEGFDKKWHSGFIESITVFNLS